MFKAKKILTAGSALLLSAVVALAQTTPVDVGADVTAAADTATTVFNAFAGLSVAALVLAMVIGFARKGRK